MKNTIQASILLMLTFSTLSADSALNDAERVRRQNAEFRQDAEQKRQLQEDFYQQNLENQEINSQIDENQLTIPPPKPLWNEEPRY